MPISKILNPEKESLVFSSQEQNLPGLDTSDQIQNIPSQVSSNQIQNTSNQLQNYSSQVASNQIQSTSNQIQNIPSQVTSNQIEGTSNQIAGTTHNFPMDLELKSIIGEGLCTYPNGTRVPYPRKIPMSDSKVVSSNYPKTDIFHKCKTQDGFSNTYCNTEQISVDGDPVKTITEIKKNIIFNENLTDIEKMDKYFDNVNCINNLDNKLLILKYKTAIFNKLVDVENGIASESVIKEKGIMALRRNSFETVKASVEKSKIDFDSFLALSKVERRNMFQYYTEIPQFADSVSFNYFLWDFGLNALNNLHMYGSLIAGFA